MKTIQNKEFINKKIKELMKDQFHLPLAHTALIQKIL